MCSRKLMFYLFTLSVTLFYFVTLLMNVALFNLPEFSPNYKIDVIKVTQMFNCILSLIIFAILIVLGHVVDDCEKKRILINQLIKRKRNLIKQNKRLTELKEYPVHLKMILVKHFIENTECNCSICLEELNTDSNIFFTLCGHLFHSDCLNEAMEYDTRCPTCRDTIYYESEGLSE